MPGEVADRYQRELAELAALHDPRLCTSAQIFDGESLQAQLQRGPLAPEAALGLAIEIVSALEAPHRLGILHGNLSTATVWVLPSGEIRLLDFNAVRSLAAAAAGSAQEAASTNEQPDPRSDLYDFGSLLEALHAGHRVTALRRIARRCREHNPDRRFQSATALREELERLRPQCGAPAGAAQTWPWRLIAFAGIAVLIGAVTWWKLASMPSGPLPVPDLDFSQVTFTADIAAAAISPDGRYAATVHSTPAGNSLRILNLASGREAPLLAPSLYCCTGLSIAPDDSTIDFVANGNLQTVPRQGGSMHRIAAGVRSGAGFSPSGGGIAFITARGLILAGIDGSDARELAAGDFDAITPAWSPDGQSIAVAAAGKLQVVSSSTGAIVEPAGGKFASISGIVWLPHGRGLLLTAAAVPGSAPQVWQVPWPAGARAEVTNDEAGYFQLSSSRGGTLLLLHSAPEASIWVQRSPQGAFRELPGGGLTREGAQGLAWLPNGWIVASHVFHHDYQLWALSPDGVHARPLPLKGPEGVLSDPVVSPEGTILFRAQNGSHTQLWRSRADGADAQLLQRADAPPPSAADSGVFIRRTGSVDNLWLRPRNGAAPRALTHFTQLQIFAYAFAPSGVLALSRGRDNTNVYLAASPESKK